MLTVWGRPSSFNVQKVMWLVGELDLAHRHIPAGGSFGGLDSAEFLAMNPHGRVPVIDDGGTVVWESHAILRYLAARYGRGRFWADDAGERSHAERWMDWSQTVLQPDFLMGVFWGFYRTPEPQRNWPAIRDKVARCARHFQLLDRLLAEQPYLAGDALTLGGHSRRHLALSLFRARHRAAVGSPRRRVVPAAAGAPGLSPARDAAVRRALWPARSLACHSGARRSAGARNP